MVYLNGFMFSCLADLFDAIANQGFQAHQAYPGGRYLCSYDYHFSYGTVTLTLSLAKIDAPNWDFTFLNIAEDLGGIFSAAQYFLDPTYGMPQLKIGVFRYRNGHGGATFWASEGGFAFGAHPHANESVA